MSVEAPRGDLQELGLQHPQWHVREHEGLVPERRRRRQHVLGFAQIVHTKGNQGLKMRPQ